MSKKDKKRKQERKEKRLAFSLNKNVAKLNSENKTKQIPSSASVNANIPDYGEMFKENFLISFINYNIGQCGLSNLVESSAKQLIKKLKYINSITVKDLPRSSLIRDSVYNNGDYSKLYKNLSPDIEIKEIDFSDSGRIFAYFIERYVCIIAIDPNHKNTR